VEECDMGTLFGYSVNRLKEPSTWAGLAAIVAALGHSEGASIITSLTDVLVCVFGGAAILLSDKFGAKKNE
jgi:hypothetical protein